MSTVAHYSSGSYREMSYHDKNIGVKRLMLTKTNDNGSENSRNIVAATMSTSLPSVFVSLCLHAIDL